MTPQSLIEDAIRGKNHLSFVANGHRRTVEPHILGVHHDELHALTYQVGGSSSSGRLPNWRRFRVAELRSVSVEPSHFAGRRPTTGPHSVFDTILLIVAP